MRIPSTEFLDTIELLYSVEYPRQFRELCAPSSHVVPQSPDRGLGGMRFICDLATFRKVNVRVGEQQWGDYERAVAGRVHPKDENRLWGGILPFCLDDDCVFGFSPDGDTEDEVLVWSVHTIVHVYPSLSAFAEAHLLAR